MVSQVEVPETGRLHVQRSSTEGVGSECDIETSTINRPGLLGLSSHEINCYVKNRDKSIYITL